MAACAATTSQPFFKESIPNSKLRTLYRTNIRSILMYGLELTDDIGEIENLDRKLLSNYLKPIIQRKRKISDRLIDRICLRIRLISLRMELESSSKGWIENLRRTAQLGHNEKVRQKAFDTLNTIQKLKSETQSRKYYTRRGGNKKEYS